MAIRKVYMSPAARTIQCDARESHAANDNDRVRSKRDAKHASNRQQRSG
jgi:hypothetical protein